jgi:hypothetical protein
VVVAGDPRIIATAVTDARQTIAVSGRTSPTPGGGILADILVDTLQSRVYASNLSRNRVQILEAGPGTWGPEVFVGADPWGLAMNRSGDSLFVANSGGTSISFVSLVGQQPREDLSRRLVTHNTPLFEITRRYEGEEEIEKLDGIFIDFSDRPQFMAQDAQGRLLYSTKPTPSAPEGTIRVVSKEVGWDQPEAKVLLLAEDIIYDSLIVAIAHVDSIDLYRVSGDHDLVEIHDHKPGFPDVVVSSGVLPLDSALAVMWENPDSDILWARGAWARERLVLRIPPL